MLKEEEDAPELREGLNGANLLDKGEARRAYEHPSAQKAGSRWQTNVSEHDAEGGGCYGQGDDVSQERHGDLHHSRVGSSLELGDLVKDLDGDGLVVVGWVGGGVGGGRGLGQVLRDAYFRLGLGGLGGGGGATVSGPPDLLIILNPHLHLRIANPSLIDVIVVIVVCLSLDLLRPLLDVALDERDRIKLLFGERS